MTEKYWQEKEYADEIHKYLREREMTRYVFFGRSAVLSRRKELLQWMKSIIDEKGYCNTVLHLAVYLLDIFMDNHHCAENHLKMATVGCLNVAIKLEDEGFAPKNSEYIKMLDIPYKLSDFVLMEMAIISFFDCSILFPTAAHFVEYYTLYALSPSDSVEGDPVHDSENLKEYVQKYIDYFIGMSLMDTVFYKYDPSRIAASSILCARNCLSILPPWPVTLQKVTSYRYGELKPCMELMLRVHTYHVEYLENRKFHEKLSIFTSPLEDYLNHIEKMKLFLRLTNFEQMKES